MDPYHSDDILPHGTPIAGWGGTAARDHNDAGLYMFGPQPAHANWFHHMWGDQTALSEPLPPTVARIALGRESRIAMTRERRTLRQSSGKTLQPLVLGKRRFINVAR